MTPIPRVRFRPWSPLAALAALAVAGLVAAADAPRGRAGDPVPAPGASGLRVVVDPHGGGIVPATARDLARGAAPAPWLEQSDEGLVVVTHPGGMKSVDLKGRFQSVTVITIDAAGGKHIECQQGDATRITDEPAAGEAR